MPSSSVPAVDCYRPMEAVLGIDIPNLVRGKLADVFVSLNEGVSRDTEPFWEGPHRTEVWDGHEADLNGLPAQRWSRHAGGSMWRVDATWAQVAPDTWVLASVEVHRDRPLAEVVPE